jgi:hypothetical protein
VIPEEEAPGVSIADDVLKYFDGRTPSTCIACSQSPEARPGVRLCRPCLEVAWVVAEAIHEQEEREALTAAAADAKKGPPPEAS